MLMMMMVDVNARAKRSEEVENEAEVGKPNGTEMNMISRRMG